MSSEFTTLSLLIYSLALIGIFAFPIVRQRVPRAMVALLVIVPWAAALFAGALTQESSLNNDFYAMERGVMSSDVCVANRETCLAIFYDLKSRLYEKDVSDRRKLTDSDHLNTYYQILQSNVKTLEILSQVRIIYKGDDFIGYFHETSIGNFYASTKKTNDIERIRDNALSRNIADWPGDTLSLNDRWPGDTLSLSDRWYMYYFIDKKIFTLN